MIVIVAMLAAQLGSVWWLTRVIRQSPGRQMFERGWELGEHKGFKEGRLSVRPVIVPLNRTG